MDYEVAVIGAGPGGLVAALYLKRFLRSTIIASTGAPRASWLPKTHNLIGYRALISGAELRARLNTQIDDLRARGGGRADRFSWAISIRSLNARRSRSPLSKRSRKTHSRDFRCLLRGTRFDRERLVLPASETNRA